MSLAEAGIDRVAAKVDQDVANLREQVERDDHDRDRPPVPEDPDADEDVDGDTELEGDVLGRKVPGSPE